jgi:hypothetical protein
MGKDNRAIVPIHGLWMSWEHWVTNRPRTHYTLGPAGWGELVH